MNRLLQLYRSTLGKKAVVAVTGVLLFGFVVMHMLGNLKVFTGREADGTHHLDIYAHFLRTMGEPLMPHGTALWIGRIVLLVALVAHVWTVILLALQNRAARPIPYQRQKYVAATMSARLMLISGLLLLGFVVVHILHFTTGTIDPTPIVPEMVFDNLTGAFAVWYISAFYLFAMILLALHLYHGVWSLFQTVGWDNPDRNPSLRLFAAMSAIGLLLGFSSVPVLVFTGVLSAAPAAVAATETRPTWPPEPPGPDEPGIQTAATGEYAQ